MLTTPANKLCALLTLLAACYPTFAQNSAILSYQDIHHPVFGRNGMVASQEAIATRIGIKILNQGGNAIDAAVAIGFGLAVTLPPRVISAAAASC